MKKYAKVHEMVPEIQVARHAAWRLLNTRMGFMTRGEGMSKQVAAEFDMDLNSSITGGLQKAPKLADVKIMEAILHLECSHTGENVGHWLHKTHLSVGCESSYIGTVVVDGASNAGKSVEILEIITQDERPQKIVVEKYDAHKVNTTADQSSGTSGHKYNVNKDCGESLTKLHASIVRTKRSGTRMAVLKRKERGTAVKNVILLSLEIKLGGNQGTRKLFALLGINVTYRKLGWRLLVQMALTKSSTKRMSRILMEFSQRIMTGTSGCSTQQECCV